MSDNAQMKSATATLKQYLTAPSVARRMKEVIATATMTPERLVALFFVAAGRTPELLNCTPESAIGAMIQAAADGLNPAGGPNAEAYLIPRHITYKLGNREEVRLEVVYQRGYRGMLKLARRSPQIEDIGAAVVYVGEDFRISKGPHGDIVHIPVLDGEPGAVRGAYCWWRIRGSSTIQSEWLPVTVIEKRRRRAQVPNSPAWRNDYEAMARKTAVRAAWAMLPFEDAVDLAPDADDEVLDVVDASVRDATTAAPNPKAADPVTSALDDLVARQAVAESTPAAPAAPPAPAAATPPATEPKPRRPRAKADPVAPPVASPAPAAPPAATPAAEAPSAAAQSSPPPTATAPAGPKLSGYEIDKGPELGTPIERCSKPVLMAWLERQTTDLVNGVPGASLRVRAGQDVLADVTPRPAPDKAAGPLADPPSKEVTTTRRSGYTITQGTGAGKALEDATERELSLFADYMETQIRVESPAPAAQALYVAVHAEIDRRMKLERDRVGAQRPLI